MATNVCSEPVPKLRREDFFTLAEDLERLADTVETLEVYAQDIINLAEGDEDFTVEQRLAKAGEWAGEIISNIPQLKCTVEILRRRMVENSVVIVTE